ncbi:MAG TPA: universal stress protein [Ktedonobacteraceae bacterium]
MNKRILLAIDTSLSPPTQHALHVTTRLLEQSSQDTRLVLLHVIPVPYDTSFRWGKSGRVYQHLPPATQQRLQAEQALSRARTALQQQGISPERIEWLQRIGIPADEIVRAAKELGVDSIVIGSRGNTLMQRIRRLLVGSTSRRVLRLSPCPVTLVVPTDRPRARNLVAWYKAAIRRSLEEHSGSLQVFTAYDVAGLFAPSERTIGIKEMEAATLALEQLAQEGLLCCQKVKGELRYLND